MDELLLSSEIKELATGDVVEGVITSVRKNEVWIDLGAKGVGVVLRREIGHGQSLEVGTSITVSVIDPEMEEGARLTEHEARRQRPWLGRSSALIRRPRNRRSYAV